MKLVPGNAQERTHSVTLKLLQQWGLPASKIQESQSLSQTHVIIEA